MKREFNSYILFLLLLTVVLVVPNEGAAKSQVKRYKPSKTADPIPGQPYEKYSTRDRFGREIIFYLSQSSAGPKLLPLVAYIEGSGCGARFEVRKGKIHPTGGHIVVANVFKDSARVLIVEKPGVKLSLNRPTGVGIQSNLIASTP